MSNVNMARERFEKRFREFGALIKGKSPHFVAQVFYQLGRGFGLSEARVLLVGHATDLKDAEQLIVERRDSLRLPDPVHGFDDVKF
jgi:hypothetical protein